MAGNIDEAVKETMENDLASGIVFSTSFVGMCVTIYAIFVVVQRKLHKNPFGILCLAHETPDLVILTTFAVFSAPATYLQLSGSTFDIVSKAFGHLDYFAWNITVYSHVTIAINRFTAIYFPIIYRQFFKVKTTLRVIGVYVLVSFLQTTPMFFDSCYLFYIPKVYLWAFSPTACGNTLQTVDMSLGISLMTISMVINMCTFWKIKSTMRGITSHVVSGDQKQHRQEVRFFMQALVQATVYIVKKLCFYVFSRFVTGKWSLFFITFYAWMLCHFLDGVILIVYNYRKNSRGGVGPTTVGTTKTKDRST
ncbi:hypothetical protein L596_026814 [Steinernema carpocapsae]|uniref:G-protein coupled receptors family 1 profile domain-containing protein n=1 Tax=Steinernema carpocapsae TaxID=34508 RepID=A0A4U5M3E7_STECR|nr:hypothetical protein L596_026814 [Steinernema carpocapsae]